MWKASCEISIFFFYNMQSSFADTILLDELNSNQPTITEKITWTRWSIFDFDVTSLIKTGVHGMYRPLQNVLSERIDVHWFKDFVP